MKGFIITTLSKKFITFILISLSFFTFLIFVHPNQNKKIDFSSKISAITNLPNIAYSNNIYEARIKENKDFSNEVFPMTIQINYLDFVYEK
jgi:hypothetical protein